MGRFTGLLAGDQVHQLVRERRMLGEVLPGMEPERVGESIVQDSFPTVAPAAARFLITTGIVSASTSVGLNSTISVPA